MYLSRSVRDAKLENCLNSPFYIEEENGVRFKSTGALD
jgi:hypothetical protein